MRNNQTIATKPPPPPPPGFHGTQSQPRWLNEGRGRGGERGEEGGVEDREWSELISSLWRMRERLEGWRRGGGGGGLWHAYLLNTRSAHFYRRLKGKGFWACTFCRWKTMMYCYCQKISRCSCYCFCCCYCCCCLLFIWLLVLLLLVVLFVCLFLF